MKSLSLFALSAALAGAALAGPPLPNVSPEARAGLADYRQGEAHRAFVISPSGAWAWQGEQATPDAALDAALATCQAHSAWPCVPYAQDGQVVFDARAWSTLWRPYPTSLAAASAKTGVRRGERLPDLSCSDERGRAVKLSDLRGKLVVVHFWGAWCGPCRRELPSLLKLRERLKQEPRVVFLFVQVREDARRSRAWLKSQKLNLPVCDSGMRDERDDRLRLADGSTLKDRQLASFFPTTLILDRHGIVLFTRAGPAPDWAEYLPFIRDVLKTSR